MLIQDHKTILRESAKRLLLMEKALKLNKLECVQMLSDQVAYDLKSIKIEMEMEIRRRQEEQRK